MDKIFSTRYTPRVHNARVRRLRSWIKKGRK